MRFEISPDSTEVLDTRTGLIWRRDFAENLTFDQAFEYAERVARETGLAWRVPTVEELSSLLDRTRSFPASAFPDMPSDWFWSSTSLERPEFTFHINFENGFDSNVQLNGRYAARLVRSK